MRVLLRRELVRRRTIFFPEPIQCGKKNMLTLEAERVLAYFRQEYWPNEERSANALQLHRSVVACREGIQELVAEGLITESLDKAFYRLTDKGVDALGFSDARIWTD
jgi:predicted transcriptional regulator